MCRGDQAVFIVCVFVRCRSDLSASAVLYAHDRYCRGLGRGVVVPKRHLPRARYTPPNEQNSPVNTAIAERTVTEFDQHSVMYQASVLRKSIFGRKAKAVSLEELQRFCGR